MAKAPYYKQTFETLRHSYPTSDLIPFAHDLMEKGVESDTVNASRAEWEVTDWESGEYNRLIVNISHGGLCIALEQRHQTSSTRLSIGVSQTVVEVFRGPAAETSVEAFDVFYDYLYHSAGRLGLTATLLAHTAQEWQQAS